ncbi:hypothetical protein EC968_005939 [Mortierella alpina]|nr:hypothetical protein EC968_005939 [Mortierella alpina]
MPDPREIREQLGGLETLYETGEGAVQFLNNTWVAIKSGERPAFTAKEGLKFKWIWYPTLCSAEEYLRIGDLEGFRELVAGAPCRHQLMVQLGIFQLLGRFAVDTQWDVDSRRSTLAFTGALYRANGVWNSQRGVAQVIFEMFSILALDPEFEYEAEQLRPSQSSLEDITSALEKYHAPNLSILRISGAELQIDTCYVNLAIVEAPAQREKEKQALKEQAAVFHRIPSSETVRGSNIKSSIRLEQLFDKRRLCDGKDGIPQRILVQGRAGIGKSTLCKKIVHLHQSGLWADRFEAVLWLPLRRLRGSMCRTLQQMLHENILTSDLDQELEKLAHTLASRAREGKVLFVLDGLDEIVTDTQSEDSSITALLTDLLDQKMVVITSRPSGLDASLLKSIDLELETIGFSQQNVKEFISKVLESGPAKMVRDFIQRTPLLQGLVNIPVQLDAICFCWETLPQDDSQITITRLYQLMSRKLWCKDALRLKKKAGDKVLSEEELNALSPEDIDELMAVEMHHLGYLAFKGLVNNHQIEFDQRTLLKTFGDLKEYRKRVRNGHLPPQLFEMLKKTSFLHSADADMDTIKSRQTWSFLHLTFQEYFAATWIASKMMAAGGDVISSLSAGSANIEPTVRFVQEQKYNPRCIAGLIGGRHQLLLASCLNEARTRLDVAIVKRIEAELLKWFEFEIHVCRKKDTNSILGSQSQSSFPETLLIKNLESGSLSKAILINTLGTRSTLSEAAILSLMDALKDEDTNVKTSAAWALGNQSTLSAAAIQSLLHALKDADVRYSAASTLSKQSTLSAAAIQSLIGALKDESADVRRRAALAIYNQSTLSEAAMQPLIGACKDENAYVRSSAASVLGNRSTLSTAAIQSLIGALKDESAAVGSSVVSALGKQTTLSAAAVRSLIDTLKDGNGDVSRRAASALGNQYTLSEAAIQFLIGTLKDEDEYIRSSAASALRDQSTFSEAAIQLLIGTLKDEDEYVRSSAVSVLDNDSMLSEAAIQPLIGACKDENAYVRSSAASALGKRSTLSEATIHFLIGALKDQNADVRSSAASALGRQSTLSEAAIYSLIDAVRDGNAYVRSSAVSGLGKQTALSKDAIHSLIGALRDEKADVRSSAVSALSKQTTLSEAAIQSLIGAIKDKHPNVRSSAMSALGIQSKLSEDAIHSLIGACKDENADIRSSAASVIEGQSTLSESAVQFLIGALKDELRHVRSSAAFALSNQSSLSEAAIKSLIGASIHENGSIRGCIVQILSIHCHSLSG